MDTTTYIALSRQLTLQRNLTTIANNIANAGTSGFHAERTLFETVLERAGGPRRVAFVQDVGQFRKLSPGTVSTTGNALDLAISGEGYFTFQTPAGPRYTRAGHLERDAAGQLVDAGGNALLGDGGAPIVIPADEPEIAIAGDGTISGRLGPLARLQLVTFANEQAMEREGSGLYRADTPPVPAGGSLVQGAIEGSNVAPVLEMTAMLSTSRAFEGTQRMIETQHELDRRAIERLISTSS